MSILGKLFPETLFPRKLTAEAVQRLRLAQARAEEALTRTHVENALLFVDTLAPEVSYERALDIYVRELGLPDPLASIVATRALVVLGESLEETAGTSVEPDEDADATGAPHAEEPSVPRLRLDDAFNRRKRA